MTNDEAIKMIDNLTIFFSGNEAIMNIKLFQEVYKPPKDFAEAFDKAIEALEKQEPKPVQYTTDHTWGEESKQPVCPVCEMYLPKMVFIPVEGHEDAPRISYCDSCGQAIDWSADDDT